ncbi:hypothetical protein BVG19_g5074 [[Candida] boidinii]|nr:hypothetical protein BVG19_g5074 [[Candida] boidinii]OWB53660.1 hypothetical protein B5S27_g5266 [[Candida] boidinii]
MSDSKDAGDGNQVLTESERVQIEITSISTKLIQSVEEKSALEEKFSNLKKKYEVSIKKLNNLEAIEKNYNEILKQNEKLKHQIIESRKQEEEANKEVERLSSDMEELSATLFDEANEKVKAANIEAHDFKIKNAKLSSILIERDDMIDYLNNELSNLKNIIQNFESKEKKLKRRSMMMSFSSQSFTNQNFNNDSIKDDDIYNRLNRSRSESVTTINALKLQQFQQQQQEQTLQPLDTQQKSLPNSVNPSPVPDSTEPSFTGTNPEFYSQPHGETSQSTFNDNSQESMPTNSTPVTTNSSDNKPDSNEFIFNDESLDKYNNELIYSPTYNYLRFDLQDFADFDKMIKYLYGRVNKRFEYSIIKETQFFKSLLTYDIEPTLRIDLAPDVGYFNRKSLLSALVEGRVVIEPISGVTEFWKAAQLKNQQQNQNENQSTSSLDSSSNSDNNTENSSNASSDLKGIGITSKSEDNLFSFPKSSPPVATHEKCAFCGEARDTSIAYARMYNLKTMKVMKKTDESSRSNSNINSGGAKETPELGQSYPLCNSCLLKSRRTCELFACLRNINNSYKTKYYDFSKKTGFCKSWCDLNKARARMFYSRIGIYDDFNMRTTSANMFDNQLASDFENGYHESNIPQPSSISVSNQATSNPHNQYYANTPILPQSARNSILSIATPRAGSEDSQIKNKTSSTIVASSNLNESTETSTHNPKLHENEAPINSDRTQSRDSSAEAHSNGESAGEEYDDATSNILGNYDEEEDGNDDDNEKGIKISKENSGSSDKSSDLSDEVD